jgi:hypothetical protein
MKIHEFWINAFLAALQRLPPADAQKEADIATDMCISKWQQHIYHWSEDIELKWKDQDISEVPFSTPTHQD